MKSYRAERVIWELMAGVWLFGAAAGAASETPSVIHDPAQKFVMLSDEAGDLRLRLNYQVGCVLDQLQMRGREVAAPAGGFTGIRHGATWHDSRQAPQVKVQVGHKTVVVKGIRFGPAGHELEETWRFETQPQAIAWQIQRRYPTAAPVEDVAFPEWNFAGMATWTGGLLDHGGVVWNKYLDQTNATYGGHFGTVTFWNSQSNDALRITPHFASQLFGAGRFSCEPNGTESFRYAITTAQVTPRQDLRRFLAQQSDLWKPICLRPGEITATFTLQALQYDRAWDRGQFVGLDGNRIRELFNTVARYGVIDEQLLGANGWRSGYICLHEPFFAQIAAAVNSVDYTRNLSAFLDHARECAITPEGRVKSRWAYGPWDAMPGSYDAKGFYEAQWGYLMDSQTSYVMNVAEQYCLTGERAWLARHKTAAERALDYLLRREAPDRGLVTMMTDSHRQQRGSDWIDIIWAAHENALVNAQLFAALNLWADAEDALEDPPRAAHYRAFADRLKASFNRPTTEGGFWDATNHWYVYWRDRDGSIHGNNLVTPVNFAAIAYGVCDDPNRCQAILERIESEMQKENLFFWPLNFFPYDPAEGAASNFPFPKYENGDLFLSWGELGVRAYATYNPDLALKYVRNTLERYATDGLSFQRYARNTQNGLGDDILAGNCLPIVGLYRDLYGLQPKPNRLYVAPKLPAELSGTKVHYDWRGRTLDIEPGATASSVTVGQCRLQVPSPFGINVASDQLQYFAGTNSDWALAIRLPQDLAITICVPDPLAAAGATRHWTEQTPHARGRIHHVLKGLPPNSDFSFGVDGKRLRRLRTDAQGQVEFDWTPQPQIVHSLTVAPGR